MQFALAMPQVLIFQKAIPAGNDWYLAQNSEQFVATMKADGFEKEDWFGTPPGGLTFQKDKQRYLSSSAAYSQYFTLFTYPMLYTLDL